MRKFFIAMLFVALCIVGFSSCDKDELEIPEGLQLVKDSDDYTFFGPEGWTVVNRGEICSTYLSSVNNTNVSFAEAKNPEATIPEYFEDTLGEFSYDITLHVRDEKCSFGADITPADEAYKYVYSYKYQERDFICMQILLRENGKFYIFTYTSYGDINDSESYYAKHLEKADLAAKSVIFKTKNIEGGESIKPEYVADADGYLLVSDRTLAGFDLYLPADYEVVDNSALVTAKASDGASITVSRAVGTDVYILDYLETRRSELSAIVENLTDIKVSSATPTTKLAFETMAITHEPDLTFGELAPYVMSYEYKYTYNGTVYHVYQIVGVDSGFLGFIGASGYVFTYTATEQEYEKHLDEIKTILEKIDF